MARTKVKAPQWKKPKSAKKLSSLGKEQGVWKPPDIDEVPQRVAALVDDELQLLTNTLGDERLAKRVLKLKKKFPDGTTLELTIMEYLDRKRISYEFQKWLLGGRAIRGGQVVDFAVDLGLSVMILEAQGSYWHNRPGSTPRDRAQRFALLGLSVWGKKVTRVIEVWENRIMQPNKAMRERTLNLALQGIELGQ